MLSNEIFDCKSHVRTTEDKSLVFLYTCVFSSLWFRDFDFYFFYICPSSRYCVWTLWPVIQGIKCMSKTLWISPLTCKKKKELKNAIRQWKCFIFPPQNYKMCSPWTPDWLLVTFGSVHMETVYCDLTFSMLLTFFDALASNMYINILYVLTWRK